jgi:hypothetical protein
MGLSLISRGDATVCGDMAPYFSAPHHRFGDRIFLAPYLKPGFLTIPWRKRVSFLQPDLPFD